MSLKFVFTKGIAKWKPTIIKEREKNAKNEYNFERHLTKIKDGYIYIKIPNDYSFLFIFLFNISCNIQFLLYLVLIRPMF